MTHQCKFEPAIDLRTQDGWWECVCGKKQLEGFDYSRLTQPQRTWVGLTNDQKQTAVWSNGSFGAGALWAEEQLKANNT